MSAEDFRVAEKFCASMPDCSSLLLFFWSQLNRPAVQRLLCWKRKHPFHNNFDSGADWPGRLI